MQFLRRHQSRGSGNAGSIQASGYSLFFSNEGSPWEPIHVHAERDDAEAKLWLVPEVGIAESSGFNRRDQTELVRIVEGGTR
jgi:hypothetical protein